MALAMLAALSCSRKYQDYAFIEKSAYLEQESRVESDRPAKMMAGTKDAEKFCQGQILFNKNAERITEASLPALVSQTCPGSEFLLDTRITRQWWTLLLYTRSCVEVESYCPKKPRPAN